MFSYDVVTGNLCSATTVHRRWQHTLSGTPTTKKPIGPPPPVRTVVSFYFLSLVFTLFCGRARFRCSSVCVFVMFFPGFSLVFTPLGGKVGGGAFLGCGGAPFSCCLLLAPSPSVFSAQTPFVLRPTGTGRSVGRVAAVLLGNAPSSRLASLRYISHRFPTNFKGFSGKIVLLTLVTARVVTCGR